jgi:hypothetical protein
LTRQLVDYLDALRLRDAAVEVKLGGRTFTVARAHLRQHYALNDLLAQLRFPAGATTYLSAATGLDLASLAPSAAEIAVAFNAVRLLNTFQGTLPILWGGPERPRTAPEDYPNRALASLVANLARAFGWTADYILEGLGPEEAICYQQEAVVAEHADKSFAFALSEASIGKGGRRQPFPALPWGRHPAGRKGRPPPIPEFLRPQGVVLTMADMRKGKGMPNAGSGNR